MSSGTTTHLERTADVKKIEVCAIWNLSTTKRFNTVNYSSVESTHSGFRHPLLKGELSLVQYSKLIANCTIYSWLFSGLGSGSRWQPVCWIVWDEVFVSGEMNCLHPFEKSSLFSSTLGWWHPFPAPYFFTHVKNICVFISCFLICWFLSQILSAAKVTHIHQESPTVKKLRLQIENDKFTFKAGQW